MKHFISFFLPLVLLGFLLFFPEAALLYAKAGLMLWFYTLLPSLLPFLIISGLFLQGNSLSPLLHPLKNFWKAGFGISPEGAYALVLGIFCGYPMGAKITGDLYRNRQISRREALYLLTFTSYPGPSFLSAYVCTGLFHSSRLIFPVYGILYLSGYLTCLVFRLFFSLTKPELSAATCFSKEKKTPVSSLGEALDVSILNSFISIARLGGYLILFSILQGILTLLLAPFPEISRILSGVLEISTGLPVFLSDRENLLMCLPFALGLIASGGLCVAAQTKSMLSDSGLPLSPYLAGKLLHAVFAIVLSVLYLILIKVI